MIDYDAEMEARDELDAALESRRRAKYYEIREACAKGAKECRIELGGNDYEDWYYTIFNKVCFELQAAQDRGDSMVSDWAIDVIAQEAIKHVKHILEKHAEVNA